MTVFYLPKKRFKKFFLFISFLLLAFWANAQTNIASGSTVAASTIPAGNTIIINAGGTLNMDVSKNFASITTAGTGTSNITGANIVTLSGSITINSTNNNPHTIAISATTTVICTSVIRGTGGNTNSVMNVTVSGILRISGTVFSGASGTNNLTCNAGSTVEYNGAGQTVYTTTYSNLTLSGTGVKALNSSIVNAILSMQGTATTSGTVSYGSSSTLEYKGSAAQTTGGEFISPFPGSGGVVINNANGTGVSLGNAKSVGANPFTIGSTVPGSIFNDGGFQLTSTGTFTLTSGTFNIGSGATATSYPSFSTSNIAAGTTVNYNSTASQTIAAVNYGSLTNASNGPRILAAGTIGIKNSFVPSTNPSSTITGNTVSFNGIGAQTIPAFNYNNLTVTNTNTNITLANSGTIGIAGVFTPGNTTFGTISGSTVIFNGTSAQTIPSFTFNNLQINNTVGISSIGGNVTVGANLALTNGIVTTGGNTIIVNGVNVTRTNGWVNGNLQEYISGTSPVTFYIGDATSYRPLIIEFSSLTSPGSLTAAVTPGDGTHPQIATSGLDNTKTVKRYWNLTASGGLAGTYDATFGFVAADVQGNTSLYVVRNYNGSTWSAPTTSTKTSTSTKATGLTSFGSFSAGEIIPLVSTNPNDVTVCEGSNTSFTSTSASTPAPTVKWQRSDDLGVTWIDIATTTDGSIYTNFTTGTLTITGAPATITGYQYRSVYTNINGTVTSTAKTITITLTPTAAINYAGSPFGSTVNTAQAVTLTGTNAYTGGTYAGSGGLVINSSNGDITPSANTPGTYTVTYTGVAVGGCAAVAATTSVTITLAPTAQISYAQDSFCVSVSAQAVNRTGSGNYTGGTYTTTAGLTIDASTGTITPATSTPGTYIVTYNIPASAPYPASTTTTTVTITDIPTASISYTGGPFCTSDQTAQTVTLSGTGAYQNGTYSSDAGLVLDPVTGAFTPDGSSGGTHTITYIIPASGGCPASSPITTTVTIVTRPAASLSYNVGNSLCQARTAISPTLTGTSGGTYSYTAITGVTLTINSTTGVIDASTSDPGDYEVLYTIPASGPCGQVQITAPVTIVVSPTASIDYPGQPFCAAGASKTVTLSGTDAYTGGTFSSSPSGLSINATSGTITPVSSSANTYTVTYTTPNCPVTATATVDITPAPTATFNYAGKPFCQSDGAIKSVSGFSGDASGSYSASPAGLSINSTNGDITPSTSSAGTYTVTYTIPASGTCADVFITTSVTITALPTATISYAGTPFCKSVGSTQPVTLSGTNAYTGGTYSAPAGLTINASTGAITPSTSTVGTYLVTYNTPAGGGCAAVPATTSVTITEVPAATVTYSSSAYCISDVSAYTANVIGTGAFGGGSFSSTPAGLGIDASGTITPGSSTAGNYTITYTIPSSGGCAAVPVNAPITINADATITLSSAGGTDGQTKCINTAITNITYAVGGGGTGATITAGALPSGVTGSFSAGVFTITGTPSVAGSFSYTVTTSGPCVNNSLSGTITVTANATISRTSAAGTDGQTKCINTPITDITYAIGGGGTGASITSGALPAGVTGSFSAGVFTITGTPTASGSFSYTVTTSGPCVNNFQSGTITVTANSTITLSSAAGTDNQTKCINTAITNITYTIGGSGTGASITAGALPGGVTGSFSAGVFTIAGTPTASGTFNYTVTTTATCAPANISGTITVNPLSVGGTISPSQIICQNAVPGQDLVLTSNTGSVIRWQKSASPTFASFTNIAVASTTLPSATIGALSTSTYFRAEVQSGSCGSVFSGITLIAVNAPFTPTITASPGTNICLGQSVTVTAGNFSTNDTIIGGDFSSTNPAGWTGQNGNASNNNTNINITWGYTNSGHDYGVPAATYSSSGASFMIVNGNVNSTLTTPSFSTIGRTALSLEWYQGYKFTGSATGTVQVSIDGGVSYITLVQYNSSSPAVVTNQFTANPKTTIDLSSYLGQPDVRIRFVYTGAGSTSTWALDNVNLVGPYQPITYTWSINGSNVPGQSVTVTPVTAGDTTFALSAVTGGCASTSNSILVHVDPTTVGGILPSNISVCTSGSSTLTLTGNVGNVTRWERSTNAGVTWTNIANTTTSNIITVVAQTTLYRVLVQSGTCVSAYSTVTLAGLHNVWTGRFDTDWQKPGNWSDSLLPSTSCADVLIQNVTNKPILGSGSSTITNLIIQASSGLTINGTGLLKIGGNITNGGTFNVSAGSLEFNGTSPQSIAGTLFVGNNIRNLTVSNTSVTGLTFTGAGIPLNILGDLSFGISNATLTTNDNLVLRSTATTTARVADITNNGTYTGNKFVGKVTVERFYPGNRSWRLVTAPLSQTGNIFNSWQNGGNYVAGKGMFVTGLNPNIGTNGLDNSNQNNFSMKGWDGVGNVYTNIADTRTTLLSGNGASAANVGYFAFVRGDRSRSPDNTIIPHTNNTTLSSIGLLQTGTQTFTATPGAGALSLIGNPYASPVDFSKITRNNVVNRFTAWDPLLNDVGGFVVFDDALNTGTYTLTSGPTSPGGMDKHIQSSQAFFVQTAAAGPASVVFNEPNKSSTNHLGMFRPASPAERKDIRIKLNKFRPDNSMYLADALYAAFDDEYSPDVTFQDAPKFGNINETFGLLRNNYALAIERRPVIKETDTLFLKLTKSVKRKYRFEIEAGKLTQDNLAGFIEDKFLNQLTPVNLEGNTSLDFEITADAASAAADRFKIIFRPSVVYTNIKASMLNSDIAVEWNLPNEYNIKEYEIERSTNGINFTKTATILSKGNSDVAVSYQWLDIAPATGEYYYRIRSISYNNVTGYSNKAKVTMNRPSPAMYVFPNPVTGNSIQLQMNSMPQGVYAVRLMNNLGQAVVNKQVVHGPGTAVEKIQPAKKLLPGLYHLEVLSPDKKITMIKVNVQ